MEDLKELGELTEIDERHLLIGQLTGKVPNLKKRHKLISEISLHAGVPEEIRSQFNVARNMALYQYFYYALAPEVQLKTYTIIEMALRTRANLIGRKSFRKLVETAVMQGWIKDAGFRHIKDPKPGDPYCHTLMDVLPDLRNESAHGSTNLTPDNIGHLEKCADLVNQLFDPDSSPSTRV